MTPPYLRNIPQGCGCAAEHMDLVLYAVLHHFGRSGRWAAARAFFERLSEVHVTAALYAAAAQVGSMRVRLFQAVVFLVRCMWFESRRLRAYNHKHCHGLRQTLVQRELDSFEGSFAALSSALERSPSDPALLVALGNECVFADQVGEQGLGVGLRMLAFDWGAAWEVCLGVGAEGGD